MLEAEPQPELASLLAEYMAIGGTLDYVILDAITDAATMQLHRSAAIAGMIAIDRRLEKWSIEHASKGVPIEKFFRIKSDEGRLTGELISFATFWGTDDVEAKPTGSGFGWIIPNVDGYKTAFFHPPYNLQVEFAKQSELFRKINGIILGNDPETNEIYSWSTDWSNYFDEGHAWWGAYFWTIRASVGKRFVVIGASTTD